MRKSNYDKIPFVYVNGYENAAVTGYQNISNRIDEFIVKAKKQVIVIDCYPGVRVDEVVNGLEHLNISKIYHSEDAAYSGTLITEMISDNLTDDRVFGYMSKHSLIDFFDDEKVQLMRHSIEHDQGLILIIGVGAALVYESDLLIYADLTRWEIQARYRSHELANWQMDNYEEDVLRKYKRAYFVEWRVADRHKQTLFSKMEFLLDTNKNNDPVMVTGEGVMAGLKQCSSRPFRVVPFFDPGVWGGQWMKEICDLDKSADNYAWCFDCVPEENSLNLKFGAITLEMPSINLVYNESRKLLGDRVYETFGSEFPIRFDFLDTMGGQNLSLQVHPTLDYIKEKFGMKYTQDESYYMLDTDSEAHVFLGLKTNVDSNEMIQALEEANEGKSLFVAEQYVNKFPAKKHDHFLIPAGTPHCSGSGSMVLEISATPYIFTFKLWDWGRLGLDGIPRPVHLDHGKAVIQYDRQTEWTTNNLVNQFEVVARGDGWIEEKTGLHELQFIETRRHWFEKTVLHETNGSVNVLNLIEGDEAIVESPHHTFEPFVVHYAETFIIPESVKTYTIRPYGLSEGQRIGTLKAYVRDYTGGKHAQ